MASRRTPIFNTTNQYLKIEGESIKVITERVERAYKLSDWVEMVKTNEVKIETPILPVNCRYYSKTTAHHWVVLEQNPRVRNITWRDVDSNGKTNWKLAFPYVVFILKFANNELMHLDTVYVYFSNTPIVGMETVLYSPSLSNIDSDHILCTGDVRVEGETLAAKTNSFQVKFWQSEFNTDYIGHFNSAKRRIPELASLQAWEDASIANSLFPLTVEWGHSLYTLGERLNYLKGDC